MLILCKYNDKPEQELVHVPERPAQIAQIRGGSGPSPIAPVESVVDINAVSDPIAACEVAYEGYIVTLWHIMTGLTAVLKLG